MKRRRVGWRTGAAAMLAAVVMAAPVASGRVAQDRLPTLPGYDAYARMQEAMRGGVVDPGAQEVVWAPDGRSVRYRRDGRVRRFDLETASETDDAAPSPALAASSTADPCPRVPVDRGRQRACAASPDGSMKAFYRDRNLIVSRADGSGEVAVTTDGSEASRVKYGSASWVYGEELDQVTAIWWAPDGRRVAFYRMDERRVRDYYVLLDQTALQDTVDVEAYPKAGSPNPVADVLVYDLASRRTITMDVREGRPFADDVLGHYVFAVDWAPDGSEVRMHRTNRLQNTLELVGCAPDTGRCRVLVREEWPSGWVEHRPTFRLLADGRRFIWASHRDGRRRYYLYDVTGRLLTPLTRGTGTDAGALLKVDEAAGVMFYMANDGDNRLKAQLHRVRLDGSDDRRLTDPAFHHRVTISPDSRLFVDVAQTHERPPASRIVSAADGGIVATLGVASLEKFDALKLARLEQFTFTAADGATPLYGTIAFPSTFDPSRRYPVLLSVYGGPEDASLTPGETFDVPPVRAELGFLVVTLGTRAAPGLGRRTLDSLYRKLGQTEVDDIAAGLRAIAARPYVDPQRIGIHGTSYGGYVALMALVRYPELFAAASASSPVTDWRLYDSIYTERYMGLPDENRDGYDKGSVMRYAGNLRGRLLLYFGTADNNVHPSNSLQLLDVLARMGKSVEVQVGPDLGHSGVPMTRMLEFFVDHLIVRPDRLRVP